jgi:hypothetical protein
MHTRTAIHDLAWLPTDSFAGAVHEEANQRLVEAAIEGFDLAAEAGRFAALGKRRQRIIDVVAPPLFLECVEDRLGHGSWPTKSLYKRGAVPKLPCALFPPRLAVTASEAGQGLWRGTNSCLFAECRRSGICNFAAPFPGSASPVASHPSTGCDRVSSPSAATGGVNNVPYRGGCSSSCDADNINFLASSARWVHVKRGQVWEKSDYAAPNSAAPTAPCWRFCPARETEGRESGVRNRETCVSVQRAAVWHGSASLDRVAPACGQPRSDPAGFPSQPWQDAGGTERTGDRSRGSSGRSSGRAHHSLPRTRSQDSGAGSREFTGGPTISKNLPAVAETL